MKKQTTKLNYVVQTWVIVASIILAPLSSYAQSREQLDRTLPQQLHLPFGITVDTKSDVKPDDAKNLEPANSTEAKIDNQTVGVDSFVEGNSTPEQIKDASPKNLFRRLGAAGWDTVKGNFVSRQELIIDEKGPSLKKALPMPVETAIHFPAEATTFYTAMGAMALAELNLPGSNTSNNPMAMQQFFEHSFKDPIGAIGFYGFMLINRNAMNFFQQLGVLNGVGPEASRMAQMRAVFRTGIVSQMSMSAAMLAQTVFTELYHDKEIQTCLAHWGIRKINKVTNGQRIQLQPDSEEVLDACQIAYERWTPTAKLKDYQSSIYAMVAAGLLQSLGMGAAKIFLKGSGEKGLAEFLLKTPGIARMGVIFRPLTMVVRKGGSFLVPEFRMAATILNYVAFIKLTEIIQPLFDHYVQAPSKAADLAETTNQFEKQLNEANSNKWTPVQYSSRKEKVNKDPALLLKKVGQKYQGFRQFQLQKAYNNYSNWQESLAQFQGTYISSYAMYDRVISEVRGFKERGNNNRYVGETPSKLFLSRESPIYRVGTLIPKKFRGPIASDPIASFLSHLRNFYSTNHKSLSSDQDRVIKNLILGFESAYRDISDKELDALIVKAKMDPSKMSAEQKESISVEFRAKRVDQALKIFAQVGESLNKNSGVGFKLLSGLKGTFKDFTHDWTGTPFNEFMWAAYTDLNGWINYAVTTAGLDYYERELGKNPNLIPDAVRENFPDHFDKAFTPSMADYLLASMVCGARPDAGATPIKETIWEKTWNFLAANDEKKETFSNLSLVQYTPGWGFTFIPPRIVHDNIGNANLCATTPKRAKQQNIVTAAVEFLNGESVQKQNLSPFMAFNINTGEHVVNGETHYGFLPLVKNYLNPRFFAKAEAGDSTPFSKFWESQVEPQAKKSVLAFQKLYRDIVTKDFVPNFVSGEYRNEGNRKIHYGAGWSLREEGMYYHSLLGRMVPGDEMKNLLAIYKRNLELATALFAQPESVKKATDIILRIMKETKAQGADDELSFLDGDDAPAAKTFSQAEINAVRTTADPAAQAATQLLLKNMKANLDSIKGVVAKTKMIGTAKSVADQLVTNMEQVDGEAESYNGVIRAANLQGLPEVSDLK